MIDYAKLLSDGVRAKSANLWPIYGSTELLDRTKYVTASEIGYCARAIKFAKVQPKTFEYVPVDQWGMFERGHNVEDWFVKTVHLSPSKPRLILTGSEQRSFVSNYQSGTPDGAILIGDNGVRTLEVKSIDPRTNVSKLPKKPHIDQLIQNNDLMAERLELVPLGGDIVYIDAADYSKTVRYPEKYVYPIDFDEEHADRLYERAEWIMAAQEPADLPHEGVYKDFCKFCAYKAECTAIMTSTKGKTNEEAIQEDRAKSAFFG